MWLHWQYCRILGSTTVFFSVGTGTFAKCSALLRGKNASLMFTCCVELCAITYEVIAYIHGLFNRWFSHLIPGILASAERGARPIAFTEWCREQMHWSCCSRNFICQPIWVRRRWASTAALFLMQAHFCAVRAWILYEIWVISPGVNPLHEIWVALSKYVCSSSAA